jgi:SPP1 family predicted phage head-tail adaptor
MQLTFFDAGQLTARLDLESDVASSDGQGGLTLRHAVTASLWARIEPIAADIEELGHAERERVTHRIWIRHSDVVKPGLRFRKGARIFAIRTVHDPDESGRYLVCRATEQ